jgi:hypothetical protein
MLQSVRDWLSKRGVILIYVAAEFAATNFEAADASQ